MKQTFEGHQPAVQFAQVESKKQNQKLSVFLTRSSGVNYVVCDSATALTIEGKLMGEYGQDISVKPIQPPPVIEVKKEEIIQEVVKQEEEERKEELLVGEKRNKTRKTSNDD